MTQKNQTDQAAHQQAQAAEYRTIAEHGLTLLPWVKTTRPADPADGKDWSIQIRARLIPSATIDAPAISQAIAYVGWEWMADIPDSETSLFTGCTRTVRAWAIEAGKLNDQAHTAIVLTALYGGHAASAFLTLAADPTQFNSPYTGFGQR